VSNGQTVAETLTTSGIITATTGWATATNPAQLVAGGGNGSSGGGMASSTKAIIGGVIGGIAGALALGALGLVAWRLWGRKNHDTEEDDDLMSSHYSSNGEKPMSSGTMDTMGTMGPSSNGGMMTNSGYSSVENRYQAPHLQNNTAQNF